MFKNFSDYEKYECQSKSEPLWVRSYLCSTAPHFFIGALKPLRQSFMAHSCSKLYNIPFTSLRFFTVYDPAGRPNVFYFITTQKLVEGKSIQLFNYRNMRRDFTCIYDIIEGLCNFAQWYKEYYKLQFRRHLELKEPIE
ncbi:MAG: NAD-dependent epimerase/dehydratase family protein [Lachnospiraceae bacterium]|nr:NAD-dependent epimerase/dehydratase family protein [Lachnospiraceae bacterium]